MVRVGEMSCLSLEEIIVKRIKFSFITLSGEEKRKEEIIAMKQKKQSIGKKTHGRQRTRTSRRVRVSTVAV